MFRLVLTYAAAGFVLMFGLASCSPEKKKITDVYAPPPPLLVREGSVIPLDGKEELMPIDIDLQDMFDFTNSQPERVEVRALCKGMNRVSVLQRPLVTPMLQILPEEALLRDFEANPADCDFAIKLFNNVGSKHVLNVRGLHLRDGRTPAVEITRDGAPVKGLAAGGLQGVRVRYRHQGLAVSRLFCADSQLEEIPFDQVMNLEMFEFYKARVRGPDPHVLSKKPVQACRVRIEQGGRLQAVSALIPIRFPRRPVSVVVAEFPPMNSMNEFNSGPFLLQEFTLTNPEATQRRIQILRRRYDFRATMYTSGPQGSVVIYKSVLEGGNYVTMKFLTPNVSESGDSFLVTIGPHESVRLQTWWNHNNRLNCTAHLQAAIFNLVPIQARDVDESLRPLDEFTLQGNSGRALRVDHFFGGEIDLTQAKQEIATPCSLF